MKKFTVLLMVLLGGSMGANYLLWDHLQQQSGRADKVQELEQQVLMINEELLRVNQQLARLDSQSLDGMARRANDALLDGWQALLDRVEQEVKNAREALDENAPAQ